MPASSAAASLSSGIGPQPAGAFRCDPIRAPGGHAARQSRLALACTGCNRRGRHRLDTLIAGTAPTPRCDFLISELAEPFGPRCARGLAASSFQQPPRNQHDHHS